MSEGACPVATDRIADMFAKVLARAALADLCRDERADQNLVSKRSAP